MNIELGDMLVEQNYSIDYRCHILVATEREIIISRRLTSQSRFKRHTWTDFGGFDDLPYPTMTFSSRRLRR